MKKKKEPIDKKADKKIAKKIDKKASPKTAKETVKETTPPPVPPKRGGKSKASLGFAVLLLVVAAALYMHHKGYLTSLSEPTEQSLFTKAVTPETVTEAQPPKKDAVEEAPNPQRESVASSEKFEILENKIQELESKLATLKDEQAENRLNQIPMDRRWIKSFLLVQNLEGRILQGLPFTHTLKPLKAIISPENYESLTAISDFGSPSLVQLKKSLKHVLRVLKSEKALSESESFWETVKVHLEQLVHFEKEKPSLDSSNAFDNIFDLVRRGSLAQAIVEVENFKSQNARVKMWLTHANAYVKTQDVLEKIKASFVEATS